MDYSKQETDEYDGYKKSAGPIWGSVGLLIGLVIAAGVFWHNFGHHDVVLFPGPTPSGEHATSFAVHAEGPAEPTPWNYVYRVVGPPGAKATITYVEQGGKRVIVNNAELPWSTATAPRFRSGPLQIHVRFGQAPYVLAQLTTRGSSPGPLTCQAFGYGTLSDQETSNRGNANVWCGYRF